jgi:hypothetical protein
MKSNFELPDFIVVGYSRSSTSWLYEALKKNDRIFLPDRKELHFYDRNYKEGLEFYNKYFSSAADGLLKGDITPVYTEYEGIAEKIHADMPNVKIIIILRNPLDRLKSIFLQLVRDGKFSKDFKSLLIKDNKLTEFTKAQFYSDTVLTYLSLFGTNQVHIAIYDDFVRKPDEYVTGIADFLLVNDDDWVKNISEVFDKKANPTVIPKWFLLHKVVQKFNQKLRLQHNNSLDKILNKCHSIYRNIFLSASISPDWEIKNNVLIKEIFKDDIVSLGAILNRDLGEEWSFCERSNFTESSLDGGSNEF